MLPAPIDAAGRDPVLILFTRRGCCLCEGLEERLRDLGLSSDGPTARLQLQDVDADAELQARYGLEVPVLAVSSTETGWRELPRVPPRLAGERLAQWLARQGVSLTVRGDG